MIFQSFSWFWLAFGAVESYFLAGFLYSWEAQHLKQPEGKSLPVLNLAMNSRLEKLIGPVAWEEDEKKAQARLSEASKEAFESLLEANLEEAMASQDPERQARASHELAACRAQKGDLDLELLSSALTLSEPRQSIS